MIWQADSFFFVLFSFFFNKFLLFDLLNSTIYMANKAIPQQMIHEPIHPLYAQFRGRTHIQSARDINFTPRSDLLESTCAAVITNCS